MTTSTYAIMPENTTTPGLGTYAVMPSSGGEVNYNARGRGAISTQHPMSIPSRPSLFQAFPSLLVLAKAALRPFWAESIIHNAIGNMQLVTTAEALTRSPELEEALGYARQALCTGRLAHMPALQFDRLLPRFSSIEDSKTMELKTIPQAGRTIAAAERAIAEAITVEELRFATPRFHCYGEWRLINLNESDAARRDALDKALQLISPERINDPESSNNFYLSAQGKITQLSSENQERARRAEATCTRCVDLVCCGVFLALAGIGLGIWFGLHSA